MKNHRHVCLNKSCVVIGIGAILASCANSDESVHEAAQASSTITVFAAASTAEAIRGAADLYQQDTGTVVRLCVAASSTLERQLEAGAQGDLFLSANAHWMDEALRDKIVRSDSVTPLLSNRLAFVISSASDLQVELKPGVRLDLLFKGRLAVGDPLHVPAGMYARQSLETLGCWDTLRERLLCTTDAPSALRAVALGEVEAGIAYATDVAGAKGVRIGALFPKSAHAPILYFAAICTSAKPQTRDFLTFLQGVRAREIFERHGFALAPRDSDAKGVNDVS